MSGLDELYEHLSKKHFDLYDSGEINEILLMLYGTLQIAFRMQSDTLVLEPIQQFCLDKDGKIIFPFRQDLLDLQKELSLTKDFERVSNIEMLDLMMERDQVVRDHLEVISKSPEKAVYKLKYP